MADVWITLNMSDDASGVTELPVQAPGFWTNYMGDCVSVIVLWGFDSTKGNFKRGRGMHGAGGVGNIQWAALLKDVPKSQDVRIIGLGGSINSGGNRDHERFADALLEEGYAGTTHSIANAPFALVHRNGTIEPSKKPPEIKATPGCCLIM